MTREEKELNIISYATTLLNTSMENINRLAENKDEATDLFNTYSSSVIASLLCVQWCTKNKTHDFPEGKMKDLYTVANFICGIIDQSTDDLKSMAENMSDCMESADEVQK